MEGIFQVYGQSSWAWLEPPCAGAAGATAGAAAAALLTTFLRGREILEENKNCDGCGAESSRKAMAPMCNRLRPSPLNRIKGYEDDEGRRLGYRDGKPSIVDLWSKLLMYS